MKRSKSKSKSLKRTWYADGTLNEVYYLIGSRKDGIYKKFDKKGKELLSRNYKNGKLDGKSTEVVLAGDGIAEFNFVDGKQNGWQFVYYEGKLRKKYQCVNGKLDGSYFVYMENGDVRLACQMCGGKLCGEYKSWLSNGELEAHLNFVDGDRHGKCIKFLKGNYVIGYFDKGKPIKKWKEIDRNGKTIRILISTPLVSKCIFGNNGRLSMLDSYLHPLNPLFSE